MRHRNGHTRSPTEHPHGDDHGVGQEGGLALSPPKLTSDTAVDGDRHTTGDNTDGSHIVNATIKLLLDTPATEEEHAAIRAVAYRAGLFWYCDSCRRDNAGGAICENCESGPPHGAPEPPLLTVTQIVSAFTGITVGVYDDEQAAERVADRVNFRKDAPIVEIGAFVPHNALLDDDTVVDLMTDRATGKA